MLPVQAVMLDAQQHVSASLFEKEHAGHNKHMLHVYNCII